MGGGFGGSGWGGGGGFWGWGFGRNNVIIIMMMYLCRFGIWDYARGSCTFFFNHHGAFFFEPFLDRWERVKADTCIVRCMYVKDLRVCEEVWLFGFFFISIFFIQFNS